MSIYKKTEGIVLQSHDYRESDRYFVVYTKDFGKVYVVARGSKKIKSKLNSHMQPFAVTEMLLAQGKKNTHLIGSQLTSNFAEVKKHLSDIALGSYCMELVDHLSEPDYKDENIFDLLRDVLFLLNDHQHHKGNKLQEYTIVHMFALKLLVYLGYEPDLHTCVVCNAKIKKQANGFDPHLGGTVCQKCCTNSVDALRISYEALNVLRYVVNSDLKECVYIALNPTLMQEYNHIIESYLHQYVEKELNSESYLQSFRS